jgi:hypothetical protein
VALISFWAQLLPHLPDLDIDGEPELTAAFSFPSPYTQPYA